MSTKNDKKVSKSNINDRSKDKFHRDSLHSDRYDNNAHHKGKKRYRRSSSETSSNEYHRLKKKRKEKKEKKEKRHKIEKKLKDKKQKDQYVSLHDNMKQNKESILEEHDTHTLKSIKTMQNSTHSFFQQLKEQENAKGHVGTIHATGIKPTIVTAINNEQWQCVKPGCETMNSKYAGLCTKCGAMKRMSEWR